MAKNKKKTIRKSADEFAQKKTAGASPLPEYSAPDKPSGAKSIYSIAFVLIIITVLTAFSINIRAGQYREWKENPDYYFSKGVPLMTMLDSYLWLKIAREYKGGMSGKNFMQVPMLSLMDAKLSGFFHNDLHRTAIYLTIILPGLFAIPLFLYFHRINVLPAGILAGMIGTASISYLTRSAVGWFTTDMMNLFFPFLTALFILHAHNDDRRKTFLFSGLAGMSMLLFMWWYEKPGFVLIYLFALVVFLLVNKIEKKTVLYSALIYAVFSNPFNLWHGIYQIFGFFSYYFFRLAEAGGLIFPQTIATITEVKRMSFTETLTFILSPAWLSLIGLLLFIAFSFLRWREAIPLLPVFLLGSFVFISSNRFAMYLAPFVGIGYGFLITVISERIFKKTNIKGMLNILAPSIFSLTFLFLPALRPKILTVPVVSSETYKALMDFKERLPKGSTIFTWWDNGYPIQEAAGFATVHDGSTQNSVITNMVARGFVTDSQRELYNIVSLTTGKGGGELDGMINGSKDHKDLIDKLRSYRGSPKSDNAYLLFTNDMVGLGALMKFGSINFLGRWGNEAVSSKNLEHFGVSLIDCQFTGRDNFLMKCQGDEVDMAQGIINKNIPVKKVVVISQGQVVREIAFKQHYEGYYIEMFGEKVNNNVKVSGISVLSERLYNTNMNQIYLLGNYDKDLFEEVYNSFPYARLFRLKAKR